LKNKTTTDDDDVVYEEIATYDEPGVVPELPILKLFDDEALEVGREINAICVSKNGNPGAEIVWKLAKERIDIALEFDEETDDATVMSSVISVVQRNLTADDDNKDLICQAWHPGYVTGFSETKLKLLVNYKPVKLPTKIISGVEIGDSVDISVSFRSNPKPSSLIWLVGDRKVYYGAKANKYISREISATGDNYYNATLHITNLTYHDMLLNYTLRVKNALGGADYHLRFEGLR
jgi:CD80-like C2-set immunoglobulin domain